MAAHRTNAIKAELTPRLLGMFKQLIAEGTLVPGNRLPAERDLAEQLGVSRSSLRQALKVLQIMGVISQRVGDGTYLNPAAASILAEPLEFLIVLDGISFHELMEARLIVEPELAARAALRASEADIAALHRTLAMMEEQAGDPAHFIEADLTFHRTIFQAAGNRVLSRLFTVVHQSLEQLIRVTSERVEPEHTLRLHRRIYQAIKRQDAEEARRRMAEHLENARDLLARTVDDDARTSLANRIARVQRISTPTPARKRRAR